MAGLLACILLSLTARADDAASSKDASAKGAPEPSWACTLSTEPDRVLASVSAADEKAAEEACRARLTDVILKSGGQGKLNVVKEVK